MGTSKSPEQFVRKIEGLANATEKRSVAAVNRGALATKNIILAQSASQGVKPTSKLARKSWGVNYKVMPGPRPEAFVRIRGPFHLVDRDTEPHDLKPKTRGRGSRKKALAFGGIVRASAHHPGTKGKGIFANAKAKADVVVPKVMAQTIVGGWRDALK